MLLGLLTVHQHQGHDARKDNNRRLVSSNTIRTKHGRADTRRSGQRRQQQSSGRLRRDPSMSIYPARKRAEEKHKQKKCTTVSGCLHCLVYLIRALRCVVLPGKEVITNSSENQLANVGLHSRVHLPLLFSFNLLIQNDGS